ncbi:MAG TPA: translation elongation factor Ts [Anaerolineales bacterium]|nr:translation elongation factor Ts [Anaerolineales bacterium]
MAISAADVKKLREETQAPMLDCKKALEASDGNFEKAIEWLSAKGLSKAAKKADRETREGLVESYIHQGNRVGVMIEVNCETDFVARNDDFKALVRNLLLQVAMTSPVYVSEEGVPAELVAEKKTVFASEAMAEGKPANIAEKIADGKMKKFFDEVCLLNQPFIKDEDKTVRDLVNQAIATIGENIVVTRFVRYELGQN